MSTLVNQLQLIEQLKAGFKPAKSAMRLTDANPVTAVAGVSDKTVKVKMNARGRNPINHWAWGNIVHDFGTMKSAPKIALDDTHDTEIGYGRPSFSDYGLVIDGVVCPNDENPEHESNRIIYNLKNGIPQQASIDWTGDYDLEYVPAGVTTQVNGADVTDCLVVRNWTLRACAICKEGADASTSTEVVTAFSASDDQAPAPKSITIFNATPAPVTPTVTTAEVATTTISTEAKPVEAVEAPEVTPVVQATPAASKVEAETETATAEKPVTAEQPKDEAKAETVASVEADGQAQTETQTDHSAEIETLKTQLATATARNEQLVTEVEQLKTRLTQLSAGVQPIPVVAAPKLSWPQVLHQLSTANPTWSTPQVYCEAVKRYPELASAQRKAK